ncbi:MAG: hypothetical protein ABJF04_07855 [Reichenbachiella sp.]|uniref:C1q-like domain-containing protein n=1 Tax=Reichenbachiella sp. TaxID=2184521 RepID=UPI003265345A
MKNFLYTILLLIVPLGLSAQSPNEFSYQAQAWDAAGDLVSNQDITVKIGIIQGTAESAVIYEETHAVFTNDLGIFALPVGSGSIISGDFSTIDWGATNSFIQIAIDPDAGSNFNDVGTAKLLSVPYAFYAKSSGGDGDADATNEIQELSISGRELTLSNGNTISLPESVVDGDSDATNEIQDISLSGSTISISDGASIDLSVIDTDTDTQLTEAEVDAFADDNGYLTAEVDGSIINEIQDISLSGSTLSISDGSSIDLSVIDTDTDTQLTEAEVDAFADDNGYLTAEVDGDVSNEIQDLQLVGNTLSITLNGTPTEIDLSPYLDNSNLLLEDADQDTKIQVEESADEDIVRLDVAGNEIMTISDQGAALNGTLDLGKGTDNVAIGNNSQSAITTGIENVSLGKNTLQINSTSSSNTAIGSNVLSKNTAVNNTGLGSSALRNMETGAGNIGLGTDVLRQATSGNINIAIGFQAGSNKTGGNNNVIIGPFAGQENANGENNIFLGAFAGQNETGSDKLYIENSNSETPLIYGEFDNGLLRINGTLNVNNAFSFPTSDGTSGQVMSTDGSGTISWASTSGDNLGSHLASQNVQMNGNWLTNDGGNEGLYVEADGDVGIGTSTPIGDFEVNGTAKTKDLTVDGTITATSVKITSFPSFSAKLADHPIRNSTGWLELKNWQGAQHNNGSNFNPTTGRFTAPRDGFYFFSAQIHVTGGDAGGYGRMLLSLNGETDIYAINNGPTITKTSPIALAFQSSCVLKLSAGDYVSVYTYASVLDIWTFQDNSDFNGYLVGEY